MKKIFNFIKEKIWILILLVLILGAVIAVLKEHTFYFGISVGLSLILFSISSRFSDILEKYNYKSKYSKKFIVSLTIFILTFIISCIDEFILELEIFGHLFGLITIFLYLLFYNIIILLNKEATNKKKFLGKSFKYFISSLIGYFSLAIALEQINEGLTYFYSYEIILPIMFLNAAYVLSPIYEYILEKANKGFGKIKRFLTLIIPISGLLLLALLLEYFIELNNIIQYIIVLLIPIITQLIFLFFTKRKYIEVKRIGFFKGLLLKTLIIILSILIILFAIKIVYITNFNHNNGEWIIELKDAFKEKINIEPRELEENESYLVMKNIKIKNIFENVNITNDYEEGSTSFIDKDGKGALLSYHNYTWDDVEYESLLESIYLDDINSYYDYLKFLYDNYKNDKLSIFDNYKTLYGTSMGLVFMMSSVEEISEIKIGDYIGFISKVRTDKNIYSISLFDTKNIHIEYGITLFGYEKDKVLDILSTIKLEESNNITLDLYKNTNIKDFESVYNIEEDLNYNYKCLDEIDENQTCINATISINNKEYITSKLYLLKNDNYYILINNYNGYSTLQIINNLGEEVQNIKFQELAKINDVYIPYSLRYDKETEKLYYYELIGDEYIYKSLDLEFNGEISIGY